MANNNDTVSREELDELRETVRDLRRLVIAGNATAPAPAVASVGDTAQALAIADLNDAVAELSRQVAKLPSAICGELAETFVVEEPEPEGDAGKAKSKRKATKDATADVDEEDELPRRRGYFGS
jgi:hypothetical protein